MTGGVFANDDPAQAAASDLTLDLGAEDASNNGLFPAVRLTTPDPQQMCAGRPYGGTDAAGNPTCVLQGVAVAGNPGGKYALFVTVANVADSAGTSMIQFSSLPEMSGTEMSDAMRVCLLSESRLRQANLSRGRAMRAFGSSSEFFSSSVWQWCWAAARRPWRSRWP